jgi:D-glycero-D-manno-heptose 1,7-bisphosphate phosphatase
MHKAIFWDSNGILNELLPFRPADGEFWVSAQRMADFKMIPEAIEVLPKVKLAGFYNLVHTNQPDIARGKMTWDELNKMNDFQKQQIPSIDATYVCPHDNKDNCDCRKPKPGLILQGAKEFNIDLSKSFVVGDSNSDIGAAKAAGVKSIFLRTSYNQDVSGADFEIKNLTEILDIIK